MKMDAIAPVVDPVASLNCNLSARVNERRSDENDAAV